MEFVKIETTTYGNKRFSFEIESEGLYKINCLSGVPIESLDKIYEVCIMDNYLILLTEDRDLRNGFRPTPFIKEDRSENNVLVYDLCGNFLWNIGSVVGDIKMPFDSISCVFKSETEDEYGITLPCVSDVLLKCTAGGFTFIIDTDNKTLLAKISGKAR